MAGHRLFIVIGGVVAIVLVWLEGSKLLFHPAFTAVRVGGISFYSRMRNAQCVPLARPATSFPTSSAGIYDLVVFVAWYGRHTLKTEWYSPGGAFYDSVVLHDRNIRQVCDFLPVYGDQAALLPGEWRLQIIVDGHVLHSRPFHIRQIQPDPKSFIPPQLCRRGCTADLNSPQGSRIRRTFNSEQALVTYLRWHPGTQITLIVGHSA